MDSKPIQNSPHNPHNRGIIPKGMAPLPSGQMSHGTNFNPTDLLNQDQDTLIAKHLKAVVWKDTQVHITLEDTLETWYSPTIYHAAIGTIKGVPRPDKEFMSGERMWITNQFLNQLAGDLFGAAPYLLSVAEDGSIVQQHNPDWVNLKVVNYKDNPLPPYTIPEQESNQDDTTS